MHSCLCLRSLLRMDENMLEMGSILGHMYFLKPSPTATSLKHCLQKLSPYFLTMGPYWPQRLHGLAPFPYFLTFLGFILAIWLSASYLCSEVVLDELDSLFLRDIMMFPDLCRTDRASSEPVSGAL